MAAQLEVVEDNGGGTVDVEVKTSDGRVVIYEVRRQAPPSPPSSRRVGVLKCPPHGCACPKGMGAQWCELCGCPTPVRLSDAGAARPQQAGRMMTWFRKRRRIPAAADAQSQLSAVTTGRVVSEEGRQWADGEIDGKTYFDHAWREARDIAARDVRGRLRRH